MLLSLIRIQASCQVKYRLWLCLKYSTSMMRYFAKLREALVGGHRPVTYKNARFGNLSLSILPAARSNSVWK